MNFSFSKIKITTKIIFLSAFLAAVFLGGTLIIVFLDVEDFVSDIILADSASGLEIKSGELEIFFREIQIDMNVIAGYKGLKTVINTSHGVGDHKHDHSMVDVADFFVNFMSSGEFIYDQLRYIDRMGNEMVRVNFDIDNNAYIVEKKFLQYKGDRDYFIESKKLKNGEIYISDVGLNREGVFAQIEIPYKPVIRYAVPLYNEKKEGSGILVSNVLVEKILEFISSKNKIISFIVDQDGNYLFHEKEEKKWGSKKDLDTGENFFNDFIVPKNIFFEDSGYFKIEDSYYSFKKVFIEKDKFWVLFKESKGSEIFLPLRDILFKDLIIGILSFSFLFIAFFITIRRILSPLKVLESVALRISRGSFDQTVPIINDDEIGSVSRAFNKMIKELKSIYKNLEDKINEKTKALSDKVADLEEARIATLNILEDVEKEKQSASQEKDKVKTILESIGDGVFVTDNEMNIILFNQKAVEISGFSLEDVLYKKYNEVIKFELENNNSLHDNFVEGAMRKGEILKTKEDLFLTRKNKEIISIGSIASPLKNNTDEIIGCVVVFRDISMEKEIDKAKTEFVSLASHQLRTPLTSINWYAEMLLSGDAGKMNEDQKDFINQIYEGNQKMVELVNSLLSVSRIDLGTFIIEPETLNFANISDEIINEMQPLILKKKVSVVKEYETVPSIEADIKLTRIIFQNLLSNAIKYTPEGGKIIVSVKKEGANILLKVSDNGFGIPKKQHKDVFKKLFRADNIQDKDVEGTGLGLYIIKNILDISGGKIWFESEENKGTTFFVSLPLSGMKKKKGTKDLG